MTDRTPDDAGAVGPLGELAARDRPRRSVFAMGYSSPIVGEVVDRLGDRERAVHEGTFVGRRAQLHAIARAAAAAADGSARAIWIEGDAGSGKSALVRHALQDLGSSCTTLIAEADE